MLPPDFRKRKMVVAGASGFIGSNLVKYLSDRGCAVRGVLHKRPAVIDEPEIEYVQADLTTPEGCRRAVAGADYLFMCAAQTSGAAVMVSQPLAHVTPNVLINALLLQAAYEAKLKKVLFISSSAAYPPTGDKPVKENQMFEGDPYEAYFSVGWMKRYAEVLCRIYAQKLKEPMRTAVVRPSNLFGPYDKFDFERSHVTAALLRRVVERHKPLEVWGDGTDVRDLLYIDDFLDGMMKVFLADEPYAEVNLASGEGHTVKEILETLLELDGFSGADVRYLKDKPRTIPARYVDTTLARTRYGFEPQLSLREGLAKTIAWFKLNAPAPAPKRG